MADIEGVGAVLEVKKDILDSLKEAQFRINQLSLSSEKLATNFSKVTSGMSKITNALTNKKFEIQFTDNGATASVTDLTRAAEMMAKTVPAAISKASSAEDKLAKDEASIAKQVEATLRRRAKSYDEIVARMAEVETYTRRLKDLEASAATKGLSFKADPDLIARLAKATGDYRAQLEALDMPLKKANALQSTAEALQKTTRTYDEAKAKIQMIKQALAELKVAGEAGYSPDNVKFLSNVLNKALADTKQLLPTLKQADKEAAKAAKNAAKAKADYDKAFNKAATSLAQAFSMKEGNPKEAAQKLKAFERAAVDIQKVASKGIVPAGWTREAEAGVTRLRSKLAVMNSTLGVCNNSARFLSNTLRYMFPTMMMYRFVKDLVSIRSEFEMAEKSLGIILKDANTASDIFREIQNIAVKSPFQVKDLVKQTKQLAAYRIETDKLVDTTKMLGDISAGVGVDMNRLILAYGQVKAATVLKGTELRQFSEAGVNMLGGLSDRFSELQGRMVTTGEVLQMISKKMVSFADVEAVLRAQTAAGGTFYRMQEKQAETLAGQISNLRDRMDIAFNEIGKSSQGIMSAVVKVFTWLITNYKLLTSVVGGLIIFKTITGLVTGLNTALLPTLRNVRDFFALMKGEELFAGLTTLGAWAPALGLVTVTAAGVTMAIKAWRKEQIALNKVVKESKKDTEKMETDYRTLLATVQNGNLSIAERSKALEDLKTQFKDILPLQDATIDKITKEKDSYYGLIQALREYGNAQAKAALQRQTSNNILEKEEKRSTKLYEQLMTMAQHTGLGKFRDVANAINKDLTPEIMLQIWRDVQDQMMDGTIDAKQATEKYYEALSGYLGVPAQVLKSYYHQIEAEEQRLKNTFEDVEDSVKKGNKALEKYNLTGSYLAGAENQGLLQEINNVKAAADKVRTEYLSKEGSNSIHADVLVQNYLEEQQKALADKIAGVKDAGHNKYLSDALTKAFDGLLMSPVQKAVAAKMDEMVQQFPSLLNNKSVESLKWVSGQDTPDTYLKRLNSALDENITLSEKLSQGKKMGNGQVATEDDKKNVLDVITLIRALIGVTEEYDLTTSNLEKRQQAQAYQANLKSFISMAKNAKKEIGELDDAGKEMFEDRMSIFADELKIPMPDFMNDEALKKWLDKLRSKLSKKDFLEIEIAWNKADLTDKMRELGETAADLWEKLDTAKVFQKYGISMPGFNVEEILEQIREVESEYQAMNTDSGKKAAKDLADRRLKTTRDEQKEAARIIYESQKKALDQVGQAYQKMYEDIDVMKKLSGPEADAGIAARFKKGFLEAADAQWELFKKTEMYTAAFGDLEGLSNNVLQTLRESLQTTMDLGGVSATDIKTIKKAIDDIDDQMSSAGINGFFGTIKAGFESIEKARTRMNNTPILESAFAAASEKERAALVELQEAQQAAEKSDTPENRKRLEEAQEAYRKALEATSYTMKELTDNQKKELRDLNKGRDALDAMKQSYDKVGGAISGVTDLIESVATAFGGEMSEEFKAVAEGLQGGFAIVSTAIAAASSVMTLYTAAEELAIIKGVELKAVMQSFLPLAIIGAALAAVAAIVKARDVSLQKQVEAHKKAVEDLDKAYEKLDKTFDKTLTLYEGMSTYNQMTSNLQKQRREIEEAISADQKRKQTQSVKDEIKDLENQLDELGDKFDEMSEKKMDFLGGTNDYQSLARDWAESWLDAFRETGNGLSGLEDSFQDFIDNIIVGQLSTRVVGQFMEQKVQPLVDAILADWKVDQGELNQLKSLDLSGLSEALSAIYQVGDLATSDASGADSTLQKGIQNVTETTAQALEALLNSTRFFVADSNAILARLEALFTGTGDIPNPMLSEMRMHTEYLRMLSGAVSANGRALNVVVKSI